MADATSFRALKNPEDSFKTQNCCDSWTLAASVLAVALLALTVVAVMARQGQLPSCTFGGQGGATAVAVSAGVLTILAFALGCCPRSNGRSRGHTPTGQTDADETEGLGSAGIGLPNTTRYKNQTAENNSSAAENTNSTSAPNSETNSSNTNSTAATTVRRGPPPPPPQNPNELPKAEPPRLTPKPPGKQGV